MPDLVGLELPAVGVAKNVELFLSVCLCDRRAFE